MKDQFFFRGFCFETDGGAGNGEPTPAADANQTTPPAGAQNTDTSGANKTVSIERFNEINNELKRFKEEAAKAAKAREEEDTKKLAEQQEWQKLADKRKTALDELAPKAELADRLSELVAAQYESEIREWPETVKAMAPAADASILTKLEWMNKARPLALELAKEKTPPAGNGRKPPVAGRAGKSDKIEPIYDVRRNF